VLKNVHEHNQLKTMNAKLLATSFLLALLVSAPLAPAQSPTPNPITKTAMELLRNNCLSCHNAEKHKGRLILTSRDGALTGGEDGPALIPGQSAKSLMIQNLDSAADPHMPPKKQLAAEEIAALRQWIDAGAAWDAATLNKKADTRAVVMHDLPVSYHPVLAIALSPDEHWLAAGRGNRVYIYDVSKPARPLSRKLAGSRDVIQSLAWSRDGKRLAAGDYGRALVWEIESKDPPTELAGLTGRVTALQFLADGNLIAADGATASPGRLHLCQLPSAEVGPPIPAHGDEILTLALNPAGTLLASGGADKTVKLWDPTTLKELAKLEGHTGHITCAAFNPDGSELATGGTDRDVKIWDVKSHDQKITHGPHPAAVTALAWFPPDTKRMLVACEDGGVRLDSTEETSVSRPMQVAEDVIYTVAVQGRGDGRVIYGGCHDGRIYMWSANGMVKTLDGESKSAKPQ
jgi:WD40 repeat protein